MSPAPDRNGVITEAIHSTAANGFVDVVRLANDYAIDVYTEEMPDDRSAFIKYADGKFSIYANNHQSKQRQRFSIAHELAHYILHRDVIRQRGEVDRGSAQSLGTDEERSADALAAEILMPSQVVHDFVRAKNLDTGNPLYKDSMEDIARSFNVSLLMAIVRMRELGYYVPFI